MAEYQLVHPENADDRLVEFDLSVADIHNHVVSAGLQAAGNASPLAPPGAAGRHAHDGYVAGLRSVLVPHGWKIVQHDMVARTVNRERQLALLVSGGNEFTGHPDGANYLTTAWPKGNRALAGAIVPHQAGFELIDDYNFDWTFEANAESEWVVWYLLHFRTGSEVRLELSAPTRLDDQGFPRGWTDRIILPPYVLGQIHVADEHDATGGEEPDVPVIPR